MIEQKLKEIEELEDKLRSLKLSIADCYREQGFGNLVSCKLARSHFPEIEEISPDLEFRQNPNFRFKSEHFKLFAKKEFNFNQITLIQDGIKNRLDITVLAKVEYSYETMVILYKILSAKLPKELETKIINNIILENC